MMRAYQGNHEIASAIIAWKSPAPIAAVIAIGSSSGGKARKTSAMRINVVSTRPPKYAASSPMGAPIPMASPVTTMPTISELRAP